jgi:hypothetical protein
MRKFPTLRADYNITPTQRVSGTYRFNNFTSNPDFLNNAEAPFPGFAQQGSQISGRYEFTSSLNSVFGTWVNEAKYGFFNVTGTGTNFNGNITPESYNCQTAGCQSIGGKGYAITPVSTDSGTFGSAGLTSWGGRNPSADVAAQFFFGDKLTGRHSARRVDRARHEQR